MRALRSGIIGHHPHRKTTTKCPGEFRFAARWLTVDFRQPITVVTILLSS